MTVDDMPYVGFWPRVAATGIDAFFSCLIVFPALTLVYGTAYWTSGQLIHGPVDVLLNYVAPLIATLVFWTLWGATPGKMLLSLRIVDGRTGGPLSPGQCLGRYLSYFLCIVPLFLGFIAVAMHPRKQGWHDRLSGTVVIRSRGR